MKEALALKEINCIEGLHLNRYHKPILSIDMIGFYNFISRYPFYDAFLTNFGPILKHGMKLAEIEEPCLQALSLAIYAIKHAFSIWIGQIKVSEGEILEFEEIPC